MTTVLQLGKDVNGSVTYRMDFSDTGSEVQLTASVAQSVAVPENVNEAWFSYSSGTDVFVNPKVTATLPTGAFLQTLQDMNPVARRVTPGQTLSFISATSSYVKVSFYRNPTP